MYEFNPLTPLDLLLMPNICVFKHKDAQAKADYMRKLHERVKAQFEKKIESYSKQANKGRKKVVFEPGGKRGFLNKGSSSSNLKETGLSKSWRWSMTMLTKLIYQVSMPKYYF